MNSNSNQTSEQRQWILHVRQTIDQDIEEDIGIPVSIFNVPTGLKSIKPECYIPQQVALGPYHHSRPELFEMEKYKLSAAKRCQKHLQNNGLNFDHLIDQLAIFEPKIRACYHKYLDFDGETLIWMMALDVSFLLEFLDVYSSIEEERSIPRVTSRMPHLVDDSGRKFAHNAILRDIVMLENQIPIFLLEKMLELRFQFLSLESAHQAFTSMLLGLYKELSPFSVLDHECNLRSVEDCTHVLGFLYNMIVDSSINGQCFETTDQGDDPEQIQETQQRFKQIIDGIKIFLRRLLLSKPVKLIVTFSFTIISSIPAVKILKQHVSVDESKQVLNVLNNSKPPLMEEISIPSVTDLVKAGLEFSPSSGGIFTIDFDENSCIFSLPVISFDVNTEVVLRNLVAYEVCNTSGPLILTRYTELMNGIIDTKEDAKLLRKKGIIVNRLKSDEEVANLWNGINKSVRLTKVPFLDKVIEDVNKVYGRKWSVKIGKLMKVHVFASWQFLAFVAVILVLFLMSVEVVSSVSRFILMLFIRSIL